MEVITEKQKIADVVSAFSLNVVCFINKKCPVRL